MINQCVPRRPRAPPADLYVSYTYIKTLGFLFVRIELIEELASLRDMKIGMYVGVK